MNAKNAGTKRSIKCRKTALSCGEQYSPRIERQQHGADQQQNVDVGSNRAPGGAYRSRFDGCKCGEGIKAFNHGRSGEGTKSWNAFPGDRGGRARSTEY
jgi:hypothetical protein